MNEEEFHIIADYQLNELKPLVWIGTFLLGGLGILISILVIIVKNSFNLPVIFASSQLSFWDLMFIMMISLIGMFLFHELIHAFTAWLFHIPVKFGWGMMGKFYPYFSVSLKKPVNKHQYIWIAVMPNLIINFFFVILILITEGEIGYSLFVLLFITHIAGGGGDAALLYTVFKYPSTILLMDHGLGLQILSKDDLKKEILISQESSILRLYRKNRGILYFVSIFILVFIFSIALSPILELVLQALFGDHPDFFIVIEEISETSFSISPNFVNCLIFSIIPTLLIWIFRLVIIKHKKR